MTFVVWLVFQYAVSVVYFNIVSIGNWVYLGPFIVWSEVASSPSVFVMPKA